MSRLILPQTLTAAVARRRGSGSSGSPGEMTGTPQSFLNAMLADTGGSAEVYHVTNLNGSGAGSFVDAITGGNSSTTRVVVFDVSGVCNALGPGAQIEVDRANLFVAGETAPDPGDGTGRGFWFMGAAIRVRAPRTVWRHLTIQPLANAWHQTTDNDLEGLYWYNNNSGGEQRGFMVVNCSMYATTDEAVQVTGYDGTNPNSQITAGAGYVDCFIPGALNQFKTRVDLDGVDPSTLTYDAGGDCHNYGPMVGYGSFGVLFLRNCIAGAIRRGPQYGGSTSGTIMNNYVFNHGEPVMGFGGVPFYIDARTGDGSDTYSPHLFTKTDIVSNLVEAGRRSNPWDVNGHVMRDDGGNQTPTRWEVYDDRLNKQISFYPQSGVPSGDSLADVNNGTLLSTPVEWSPTPALTSSNVKNLASSPIFTLPQASILSTDDIFNHVKTKGGAWPSDRHAQDQWYIDEVEAKTYDIYGRMEARTAITTRTGAPPAVPSDPWSVEANGLPKIENWLNGLHLVAGGANDYAAAEWFNRATEGA